MAPKNVGYDARVLKKHSVIQEEEDESDESLPANYRQKKSKHYKKQKTILNSDKDDYLYPMVAARQSKIQEDEKERQKLDAAKKDRESEVMALLQRKRTMRKESDAIKLEEKLNEAIESKKNEEDQKKMRQQRIVRKQDSFLRRKNTMREPTGGQLGSLL